MARLFGTDGVRGVANVELTPEIRARCGNLFWKGNYYTENHYWS